MYTIIMLNYFVIRIFRGTCLCGSFHVKPPKIFTLL